MQMFVSALLWLVVALLVMQQLFVGIIKLFEAAASIASAAMR